ncbi:MAG: Fe-S-containing hydro-lyase [Clostridia bacterium]|nr:Fe-S-containing hydro-lyase [Clostridia bacterium]
MYINTPLTGEVTSALQEGQRCYITGTVYMARDAAHKRMVEAVRRGEKFPFDIENQIIYFAGPCPAKPGAVIGSCGPTTSYRMDAYSPFLLDRGLKGMIGKGERNEEVTESIRKNKAVYFGATGGAGALLAKCIKSQEIIAYEDLGAEALRKLYVENFPVIVLIK